jgi:hypothetical protein
LIAPFFQIGKEALLKVIGAHFLEAVDVSLERIKFVQKEEVTIILGFEGFGAIGEVEGSDEGLAEDVVAADLDVLWACSFEEKNREFRKGKESRV